MSGLSASFNIDDPLYVQHTFYVDSKFGTASPPAEGQRPDRAFVSGNDAIDAATSNLTSVNMDIAVVRFRPGPHILYQRDHYTDRGALVLYAEAGAHIYIVRDVPPSSPEMSVVTVDFSSNAGDFIVAGHGVWNWGNHFYQSSVGQPAMNGVFRILGGSGTSILSPNSNCLISIEAEQFHTNSTITPFPYWFIEADGFVLDNTVVRISCQKIDLQTPESNLVYLTGGTPTLVSIRSERTSLSDGALVNNITGTTHDVEYYCPQHYGYNIAAGGPINFRLVGGSSIYPVMGQLNAAFPFLPNCTVYPVAGKSHVHAGLSPSPFGAYGELFAPVPSYFSGGEIVITGLSFDDNQPWINTLSWGESRACIEFDFAAFPVTGTVFAGFGLEGQTLRSFDVRVTSPLTPGATIRLGTSINPLLTGAVTTTTLNTQVLTPTPINVTGSAYEITTPFEQFAITRISGPIINQGRIQLYPRLGGALKI